MFTYRVMHQKAGQQYGNQSTISASTALSSCKNVDSIMWYLHNGTFSGFVCSSFSLFGINAPSRPTLSLICVITQPLGN